VASQNENDATHKDFFRRAISDFTSVDAAAVATTKKDLFK
jgi:hypothetical protein